MGPAAYRAGPGGNIENILSRLHNILSDVKNSICLQLSNSLL